MKWGIYNVIFALIYPFLLPGFLVRMIRRGGYAARMGDRFALYPDGLFGKNRPLFDSHKSPTTSCQPPSTICHLPSTNFIWIHAVSVGEVQVAGQLMREWRMVEPDVRFCFSTTSSTGWMMAQKELASLAALSPQPPPSTSTSDILIYNPLDFPNFVKSALRTVRPRAIVLTESEIWPNFILQAKRMGIPLFLINARVSDRSAPRYRLARFFFRDVLSAFTRIFAQSDLDKARLVAAGAPAEKVDVTGSFKFDVAHRNEAKEQELREWIAKGNGEQGTGNRILLGGSTWPGEDEVLLRIYKKLLTSTVRLGPSPSPLLVLAPRHFEKADAVEANICKYGFSCVRRSREAKVRDEGEQRSQTSTVRLGPSPSPKVFLADTTGELMGLYGIADVVFIGKSLCAHGSQNMIEPCLCGKPTFVGPYTENFRPVMSDLLAANAVRQVKDEVELEKGILEEFRFLTSGQESASPLGERAKAAVENRRGVVARCVTAIRSGL